MNDDECFWTGKSQPLPFDRLTKIKGNPTRHIEQLWDEINKLKERICELEKKDRE